MKFIVGTKKHMTQVFNEDGSVNPVTILQVEPNVVTQVKNKETDGYSAIQVGFGNAKENKIAKAQVGHSKKALEATEGERANFRNFLEFRMNEKGEAQEFSVGDKITVDLFSENEKVSVSSVSKGKGFQGAVKRYGFKGGRRTHGQKHSEREVGSIGATGPARVLKGQKMPGRMGGDRVTVLNLKVLRVDSDKNEIYIGGAVPGRKGTVVEVLGS